MGTGATKQNRNLAPETADYSDRSVVYNRSKNNIVVVYGEDRKLANRVITQAATPGARVELLGGKNQHNTICILKQKAVIRNSGVLRMDRGESLLRLEEGASIDIGPNAHLIVNGILLLEKDSRLILEPGAFFSADFSMCLQTGVTLTITEESSIHCINARILRNASVGDTFDLYGDFSQRVGVTWSEDDRRLLILFMLFFCKDHRLPAELIYPLLLPTVCRRYGVLMMPEPYMLPKHSTNRWEMEKVVNSLLLGSGSTGF